MPYKKCFKCGKRKDLNDFYAHPQMADGHLGKCKSCTKRDVHKRYDSQEGRTKVVAYEKQRALSPERRKKALEYQRKRRAKNPRKNKARQAVSNAVRDGRLVKLPCQVCGSPKSQAHHPDYRSPLKVVWLCFKHHREIHNQTVTQ